MDIKQASDQIEGALRAYLARDERGLLRIPFGMQRPLLLMGPPGVGKTAVVAQVAERLGVNFVSYSITHHTRQSALGLPFISQKDFGGRSYRVSEYTMSEIIGACHEAVEATGVPEGVLFLDEVNCVSETLAPSLLQFLQSKTFGQHRLPEGWVIAAAGNPPEYNRSARDFDLALLDRMRRIDVEPSLSAWQSYAVAHGVHPVVISYLEGRPKDFYLVRAGVDGARIVTPRGWEDLSRMLQAYESEGMKADVGLVRQYLQDDTIASDFVVYLDLFEKYRGRYDTAAILAGRVDERVAPQARAAAFDERVALVSMLADAVRQRVHRAVEQEEALGLARKALLGAKGELGRAQNPASVATALVAEAREDPMVGAPWGSVVAAKEAVRAERMAALDVILEAVEGQQSARVKDGTPFDAAKRAFNGLCVDMEARAGDAVGALDNALVFLESAFGDNQEMLIFVTRLASDPVFMRLVSRHRSEQYLRHNDKLLLHERCLELLREVDGQEGSEGISAL